jgi:hypothetical protein
MSQAESSNLQLSSSTFSKTISQIFNGAATIMAICGGIMGIVGLIFRLSSNIQELTTQIRTLLFFIITLIISFQLLITNIIMNHGVSDGWMCGAAIGFMFAALFVSSNYGDIQSNLLTGWWRLLPPSFLITLAIVSFFFGIVGGFFPDLALFFSFPNIIFGIIKLYVGVVSIRAITDIKIRNIVTLVFVLLEWCLGFIFCFLPIFIHLNS